MRDGWWCSGLGRNNEDVAPWLLPFLFRVWQLNLQPSLCLPVVLSLCRDVEVWYISPAHGVCQHFEPNLNLRNNNLKLTSILSFLQSDVMCVCVCIYISSMRYKIVSKWIWQALYIDSKENFRNPFCQIVHSGHHQVCFVSAMQERVFFLQALRVDLFFTKATWSSFTQGY